MRHPPRLPFAMSVLVLSLVATSFGFSRPALAHNGRVKPNYQHPHMNTNPSSLNNERQRYQGIGLWGEISQSGSSQSPTILKRNVPMILFRLNASTKWVVTIFNSLALWTRPHRFEGPFIVFGSIMAVYFTGFLKKMFNQGRPEGAPFTDPGMPSSHSLTCFFMASAWNLVLAASSSSSFRWIVQFQGLVWAGAAIVAWLRVVCGYHSWAQVGVGAGLGSLLGSVWVQGGKILYQQYPSTTFYTFWGLYLSGSALFISKNMKDWVTHEKHL